MYTLYIDTHFVNLVLAIFKDNEVLIEKKLDSNKVSHSENTIPLLKEMLDQVNLALKDLKEIIVILGPGSFTGVRIGIVIAKIIAYSLNIKIKALSYLKAMALEFNQDVILGIKDKNGAFIGEFDAKHNLVGDYYYLKNDDLNNSQLNIVFDKEINLQNIKKYVNNIEEVSYYSLVPLYVKKIEVEHD